MTNEYMIATGDPKVEKVKRRSIVRRSLPTYQVGTKLYKTVQSAASAEAWAMICRKYCDSITVLKLSDMRELHGMICDCCETDYGETDRNACPIHCHHYGYLARLHARLARLIETSFEEIEQ